MSAEAAIALLVVIPLAILVGFITLIVTGSSRREDHDDATLRIQQERNQIMRDAVELKRFEMLAKYQQQQQQVQQQPPQIEAPKGPTLKKGEIHTYQRKQPQKQFDTFPEDAKFQAAQADNEKRIERIKRWRSNDEG